MLAALLFSTAGLVSIFAFLAGYVLYYYVKLYLDQKSGKTPPGPWGLPLVGSLPFLKPNLHEQLVDLKQRYGPVIQMKIGQGITLFLNDSDSIREAFKQPVFNARPHTVMLQTFIRAGERSLLLNSGKPWKTTRKEAIKALSLFSTSKNSSLEAISSKAVAKLIEKLNDLNEEPIYPRHTLMQCTAAMLSELSFGLEVENQNSPELQEIFKMFDEVLPEFAKMDFLEFLPILAIFYRKRLAHAEEEVRKFVKFVSEKLAEHQYDGVVRTIVDGLKKAAQEVDEKELESVGLTQNDIIMIAVDLFDGGFFSTAENSHWLQLLLAAHPQTQARVHQELDRVVGRDRRPGILDEDYLPFTKACILETLRFATSIPSAPHATMADTDFRGYTISANTMVMPNFWAANHDPELFPEPFKFLPERFLTEDGAAIDQDVMFKTIAFGAGGRRCVGENFAKQMLFIINSHILHEFQVMLDPAYRGDPLQPKYQITLAPGDCKLIYKKR